MARYFFQEPGHEKVRKILKETMQIGGARFISAINVGELIYIVQRRSRGKAKLQMLVKLSSLDFTILPCPNELIFHAAELKARFAMSYADAFVVASALEHRATVVTGDPEFRQVEHLVKIIWV